MTGGSFAGPTGPRAALSDATLLQQIVELGAFARQLRGDADLTQSELALRAGVGLMTVIRIEAGHPGTGLLNVQKVFTALGHPLPLMPTGSKQGRN